MSVAGQTLQTWLGVRGRGLRVVAQSPEPRAQSAFSLVELIVALAILSVGLLGAVRVFPVGLRASQRAELRSRATMLAERRIETLKLEPCANLNDAVVDQEGFTVTTRISQPSHLNHLADPAQLKTVHVTVGWNQSGQPRDLGFATYVWCSG